MNESVLVIVWLWKYWMKNYNIYIVHKVHNYYCPIKHLLSSIVCQSQLPFFHPVSHLSSTFLQSNNSLPSLPLTLLCIIHIHWHNCDRVSVLGGFTFNLWKKKTKIVKTIMIIQLLCNMQCILRSAPPDNDNTSCIVDWLSITSKGCNNYMRSIDGFKSGVYFAVLDY